MGGSGCWTGYSSYINLSSEIVFVKSYLSLKLGNGKQAVKKLFKLTGDELSGNPSPQIAYPRSRPAIFSNDFTNNGFF